MRQIGILALITGIIIFISGCKKAPSLYGIGKVKTKTTCSMGSCNTITYTYDALGRINTTIDNNGTHQYTYTPDSINISNYNGGNANCTYILNSSGFVSSIIILGNPFNPDKTFSYNNNGFLISTTELTTFTNYTISNGNTIITYYWFDNHYASGSLFDTTYSTFLPDTDKRDYGMAFLGKSNINLIAADTIRSSTYINYQSNNYTTNDQHSYTFDSQHRVSTETVSGSNGTTTYSFTYY